MVPSVKFLILLVMTAAAIAEASPPSAQTRATSSPIGHYDFDDVQLPPVPRAARANVLEYSKCLQTALQAWRASGRLTSDPDYVVDQCAQRKKELAARFVARIEHAKRYDSPLLRRQATSAYFRLAETPIRVEVVNFSAVDHPSTAR